MLKQWLGIDLSIGTSKLIGWELYSQGTTMEVSRLTMKHFFSDEIPLTWALIV